MSEHHIARPHAYRVEVLANPGRPSERWQAMSDDPDFYSPEVAQRVVEGHIDAGYDPAHLRVASVHVTAPLAAHTVVSALVPEPGQRVLVTAPAGGEAERLVALHQALRESFPGVEFVLVDASLRLSTTAEDVIVDYRQRLMAADRNLTALVEQDGGSQAERRAGKAEGVRLCVGYLDEALRMQS